MVPASTGDVGGSTANSSKVGRSSSELTKRTTPPGYFREVAIKGVVMETGYPTCYYQCRQSIGPEVAGFEFQGFTSEGVGFEVAGLSKTR